MYLKELTVNGFKSFAKKSELDFSASITAVVGPNGSGKSNVAEAFRFVLGEQSPSKMRGKKGEDLIWGGSESLARANRASVSITLNNEHKVFPIDFDEITVERIVNRDGTNEYFLNGSRTRLRDIHELFAAANIGSTGHHIISQGEADRILTANPKERREMVEDALGLKIYQYKKQESERKLAKTLENIAHVESLRREVAPHLKFLERQVKKIEKSLELKEQLKRVYAEYLRREDLYLEQQTAALADMRRTPQNRADELLRNLSAAKERLASAQKDEKSVALVALEEQIASSRNKRQTLTRESGNFEGQISYLTRRIEEKQQAEAPTTAEVIPLRDVAAAAKQIETEASDVAASTEVATVRAVLQRAVGTLNALIQQTVPHTPAAEHIREEKERDALKLQKDAIDAQLQAVIREQAQLEVRYDEIRESIEAEQSANREAEREVFSIMNEQREIAHELSRIDDGMRMIERDRASFVEELKEAVALIGSSARMYKDFVFHIESGKETTVPDVLSEARTVQENRRRELEKMKIRLEELGGTGEEDVLKEYTDVRDRDAFLAREIDDLTQSVEKLEAMIAELTSQLNDQFLQGIEKIGAEFSAFFKLMFGGGEAKLIRVKPKLRQRIRTDEEEFDDPMSDDAAAEPEGIEIDVKLPNKRVRGLDMLSGGERALTSIALIFAMSQVNPPPFVILDETDAALDEANSRRYGDMIQSLARRSQLILITHNRETMSRAGVLYGVTMGSDGVSKLLSVKFEDALAVAK